MSPQQTLALVQGKSEPPLALPTPTCLGLSTLLTHSPLPRAERIHKPSAGKGEAKVPVSNGSTSASAFLITPWEGFNPDL